VSFRPQPDTSTTLIRVVPADNTTYGSDYIPQLKQFLANYDPNKNYTGKQNCASGNGAERANACFFDIKRLGPCGSLDPNDVLQYNTGTPCLLLKMNKVIAWQGKPILCHDENHCDGLSSDNIAFFKKTGRPGVPMTTLFDGHRMPFTCEGQNDVDSENIQDIKWWPNDNYGSVEDFYYPYMNQANYQQPFVMAQIQLTRGALTMLRCRIWAQNIANVDVVTREGAVMFEYQID